MLAYIKSRCKLTRVVIIVGGQHTTRNCRKERETPMRIFQSFVALAALPMLANSVLAVTTGFQGDYAPANFTLQQNGGDGSVNTGGAPASIVLSGSDNGTGGNTDFSLIVPGVAPSIIKFNWSYASVDDPGFDSASYLLGGGSASFLSNANGQSGNVTFVASPGDTFGFRVNSADGIFGRGVLTVSNFSASDLPPLPTGQWNSQTFRRVGDAEINNLADADDAINTGVLQGSGLVNSVNYLNDSNGGDGNFGGGFNPLGIPLDSDDFTVKSTGFLQIGEAGNYQFRNNTDDGSRLRIDLNGNGTFELGEDMIIDDVLSAPHNADSAVINLLAGQYMIEHVWFERGGGAEGDLGISRDGGAFLLLGNPQNDGIGAFLSYGAYVTSSPIIPEPATAALGLLALGGLMMRRRRMA